MERLTFLQIKTLRDGRPYEVTTPQQFIETFTEASVSEQNLLCELYLHNEAMLEDRTFNLIPIAGDILIRALVSFMANQLTWQNAFLSAKHNEENHLLWIRAEPQNPVIFITEHNRAIKEPRMAAHISQLQASVLQQCQQYIKQKGSLAMKANNLFWENCPKERREYHPFNPPNLDVAISSVPNYVRCVQECGNRWLGYHFHFPLLWLPVQQYKAYFKISKKEELAAWQRLQHAQGFRNMTDSTFYTYCISNLHCTSQYSDSDSD